MAEHHYLERAAQQLQQRFVFLRRLVLGCDVLLAGAGVALVTTLLTTLMGWSIAPWLLYGVLAVGTGGGFAGLAWRVRGTALELLIRADRFHGFHAALSTAYEYGQQYTTNPFVPGLIAVAERLAPRVQAHHVLPVRLPRRVWGIPLLVAMTLGVGLFKVAPWRFDHAPAAEMARQVSHEGQRLEKWGRELEELARREQLDRSMILARQLQQLGQRLQQEGGEKGQVAERMATLSQYLRHLQQELRERALMSDSGGMAAAETRLSGKSLKQELRELLHLLQNEAPARETAAMAEQSVLRLRRQVGQNAQLDNLLQNLRAGDLDAARQLLQEALQQQQAAEEVEQLDRARRALEYSSRSIQRGGHGDTTPGRTRSQPDSSRQNALDMGEDEMFSEHSPGMEDFPTSGAEEGVGTSTTTRQSGNPALRESEQAASHVEVPSGEGPMRLSYIRYLPMQNEAQVPVEQAVVQYQHAAEEVLTQEHIPRAYREQIKQYFLSLGMMK